MTQRPRGVQGEARHQLVGRVLDLLALVEAGVQHGDGVIRSGRVGQLPRRGRDCDVLRGRDDHLDDVGLVAPCRVAGHVEDVAVRSRRGVGL